MPKLTWDKADAIGYALYQKYPDVDPLTVRFTDLLKWIIGLEGFEDDPAASNEGKLEAIQMAWNEEREDDE